MAGKGVRLFFTKVAGVAHKNDDGTADQDGLSDVGSATAASSRDHCQED